MGGELYVWGGEPPAWENMGSVVGPTGPTGAAGASISGAYETYEEFIQDHPTGTTGEAYLVDGELYVWGGDPPAWENMGSLIGPTGPTGAAGASISGSYETYDEFIQDHPTGTTGEAYLVDGDLYVWGGDPPAWENMGSVVGPTGPTGAAGASISGSYETYDEFIQDHPTGTTGEAYLVAGELYVWGGDPPAWENMGSLIGPTGDIGPTGAAGVSISGSYETYDEFIQDHPTGTTGEAYLVAGELYVWGGDPPAWENMGSLIGPTGPTGAAGASISGSYETYDEFIQDHPTGTTGEAYLVAGELYVWGGDPPAWENMGSLIGPTGPPGATILGSYETIDELRAEHPTGNPGDAYLVAAELYVWDAELNDWRSVGSLRGPQGEQGPTGADGPEAFSIIPFCSQQAPISYVSNGVPTKVTLLGFGYSDGRSNTSDLDDFAIPINSSDGAINLESYSNNQMAFSLPFDTVIRSIALTVGNWGSFEPAGTVYPYIQIYSAAPESNTFMPIPEAIAVTTNGLGPGTVQANTMRAGLVEDLEITLPAGTRILIGALVRTVQDSGTHYYWLYFTGGIGITRWVQ